MARKNLIGSLDKRLPALRAAASGSPADGRLAATVADIVQALRQEADDAGLDALEIAVVRLSGLRGDFLSSGGAREVELADGVLGDMLTEAGVALRQADALVRGDRDDAPAP